MQISYKSMLLVLIMTAATSSLGLAASGGGGGGVPGWNSAPSIEGAAINRSMAIRWVNITESVNLQAAGSDGDTDVRGTVAYDFIDLAATTWSCPAGNYLSGNAGAQVTFSPTAAGITDIVVTATIKDLTTQGKDDPADVTSSQTFNAYKVGCKLSFNGVGINGAVPSPVEVWQGATTGKSATRGLAWSQTAATANASGATSPNPGATSAQFMATWTVLLFPGSAALDSGGTVDTPISLADNGRIYAKTVLNEGVGPDTVGISLTGGAGLSAGMTFAWNLTSTKFAVAGIGAAMSSDDLGDGTTTKLEISGTRPAGTTVNYLSKASTYDRTATFVGTGGSQSRAKYLVTGQGQARNSDLQSASWYSTVTVKYAIDAAPSYIAGSGAEPDPGYHAPGGGS